MVIKKYLPLRWIKVYKEAKLKQSINSGEKRRDYGKKNLLNINIIARGTCIE